MKPIEMQLLRHHALGMSVISFAQLLGVHQSSVYRWENMSEDEERMKVDADTVAFLVALTAAANAAPNPRSLGKRLSEMIVMRGRLRAYYEVLQLYYGFDQGGGVQ